MGKKFYSIILAKGNSERIKNKNLYSINGKPLLQYSIEHALNSKFISKTFISSESQEIKNFCKKFNTSFIKRPSNLCKKKSTSEEALIHAIKNITKYFELPDYIVFLQPTSPYRGKKDIDQSIQKILRLKIDSIFSASLYKNHIWNLDNKKKLHAVNHTKRYNVMHQYKKNQLIENGSFWIFDTKKFLKYKNRLFGYIDFYLQDEKYSYQIDEKHDIKILEALLK